MPRPARAAARTTIKQQARLAAMEQRQTDARQVYRERVAQYPTDLRQEIPARHRPVVQSRRIRRGHPRVLQARPGRPAQPRPSAQVLIGRAFFEKGNRRRRPPRSSAKRWRALRADRRPSAKVLMYWLARAYDAAGQRHGRSQGAAIWQAACGSTTTTWTGDARKRLEGLK